MLLMVFAACDSTTAQQEQVTVTSTVSQSSIKFDRVALDNIVLRIVVRNVSSSSVTVPDQPCTDVYYMEQGEGAEKHRLVPFKFCDGPAVVAFSIAPRDSAIFIRNLSDILPKCDVQSGELRVWSQLRFDSEAIKGTVHFLEVSYIRQLERKRF